MGFSVTHRTGHKIKAISGFGCKLLIRDSGSVSNVRSVLAGDHMDIKGV